VGRLELLQKQQIISLVSDFSTLLAQLFVYSAIYISTATWNMLEIWQKFPVKQLKSDEQSSNLPYLKRGKNPRSSITWRSTHVNFTKYWSNFRLEQDWTDRSKV